MQVSDKRLKSIIESILFVAERPVSIQELAQISGAFMPKVQEALSFLITAYKDKGINIVRKGDYVQFCAASKNNKYTAKYLNINLRERLTKEALETLSIIFYKQPLSRAEVEKIRGVDSESVLQNLQIRGLIKSSEEKKMPGKPLIYTTTMEFVQYFGVENVKNLMQMGKKEIMESKSNKLSLDIENPKKTELKTKKI